MYKLFATIVLATFIGFGCTEAPTSIEGKGEVVTVAQFSVAKQLRDQYAPGAPITAVCDADGKCVWAFEGVVPASAVLAGGECQSYGGGAGGIGATACTLYSDAKRERDAMVADGWVCEDIEYNREYGVWVFRWADFPDDGSMGDFAPAFEVSCRQRIYGDGTGHMTCTGDNYREVADRITRECEAGLINGGQICVGTLYCRDGFFGPATCETDTKDFPSID